MEKPQSQTWTFFGYLFDMDQDQQQQTKPRKRFVGKARKQEGTAPDSGNIEDGAVGFASMYAFIVLFVLMPPTHMQSRHFFSIRTGRSIHRQQNGKSNSRRNYEQPFAE
jgi:hypothetical protein